MIDGRKGLSSDEVISRAKQYGANAIELEKKKSLFSLLLSQYKNVITYILVAATFFSLIAGENLDAIFILLVLVINGLFGFIQEYRAEKTLQKLKDLVVPMASVIRDGQHKEIDSRDIVPGDIVVLYEGDKIPADGVLLTDIDLDIDESVLTGESMSVEKKKEDELYSGTFVVQGRGYMEVKSIGFATKLGEIAKELEGAEKPTTPLADSLDRFGKKLVFFAVILCLMIVPIGILQGREFKELVLTVVSLAVAVIPTGLPLVVTITLALGVYRMVQKKTIIRKMASIETLGATDLILSDKTGTITQNKMSVKTHWLSNENNLPLILRASILGNTAELEYNEDTRKYEAVGDKTDGALLLFTRDNVENLEEFKKEGKIIEEKPFDPEKKIIEVKWQKGDEKITLVRGAPEKVLEMSSESVNYDIKEQLDNYAREGLRVIGFGYKKEEDKEFEFLGMIGIYDPPREEAKVAVEKARTAGIKIVMVTGDNPVTARSISRDVGLIDDNEIVITSDEVAKMSDEELLNDLPKIRVFARMMPQDKLRLVRLFRKAGHVVAVTGDGVNDSLALSEAHIGVAMGGTGTDIAKEASDMVITDDNLYTVINAVEEGRGIYDNILKVIIFLLSSNVAEFVIIFFGVALGLPIPLSPTQILWVNLVSDGFPAMALASDNKRKNILNRKPRDINEQILNKERLIKIGLITAPFCAFLIVVYVAALNFIGELPARMLTFNLLVVGEMIIAFIVRGGFFPINRFLIISVGISLLLQLIININPLLRSILS